VLLLVKKMGGFVYLETLENMGSLFHFLIPTRYLHTTRMKGVYICGTLEKRGAERDIEFLSTGKG